MDLKHIIDQKDHYADYMVDEITHICRDFEIYAVWSVQKAG